MAKHGRQVIREAVRDILLGKTAAEDRVFSTRRDAWKKNELPGISVDAVEETIDKDGCTLDGTLARTLQLGVLAVVSLDERNGDELDAIALEIEAALHADPTFGRTATSSLLSSTALDLADADGLPVGAVRLTYEVRYYTPAPA